MMAQNAVFAVEMDPKAVNSDLLSVCRNDAKADSAATRRATQFTKSAPSPPIPPCLPEKKSDEKVEEDKDDDEEEEEDLADIAAAAEEEEQEREKDEMGYDPLAARLPRSLGGGQKSSVGQGTLFGVYLPCLQNILGVIVFLRLPWIVGEAGSLEAFTMVLACSLITLTTANSMAAIATNGHIPAGGAYYMITKCLGAELGGAVGILFYIGTSLGASMYIIGAVEIVLDYLYPGGKLFEDRFNNFRFYGTVLLLLSSSIVFFGVALVTKFAVIALLCVLTALLSIFIGLLLYSHSGKPDTLVCHVGSRLVAHLDAVSDTCKPIKYGDALDGSLTGKFCPANATNWARCDHYFALNSLHVTPRLAFPGIGSNVFFENTFNLYGKRGEAVTYGYRADDYSTMRDGHKSDYVKVQDTTSFIILLGIFFPSVTGIMAGANRSGDLINPSHSIPVGTLAAQITTSTIYLAVVCLLAASTDRLVLRDKLGESLGAGMVVGYVAWPHPKVTEIGALLSTFGAGLQALTGAPRLLQAIASDRLFPYMDPIAILSKRNEPVRALVATFFLTETGILIGNLDLIAPLLSMFFLLFYAAVNMACLIMSLLSSPHWRPTFRFFHWSISLVGVTSCIAFMFLIGWYLALIALTIFSLSYLLIRINGAKLEWGTGVIGMALNFATQSLLLVSRTGDSTKKRQAAGVWRPEVMIFVKLVKQPIVEEHENKSTLTTTTTTKRRENKILIKEVTGIQYHVNVNKEDAQIFNLARLIKQGHGLAVAVAVITCDTDNPYDTRNDLRELLKREMLLQHVEGLSDVYVTKSRFKSSFLQGISSIVQLSGLGKLRANTIMMRFPQESSTEKERDAFIQAVQEGIDARMAIIAPLRVGQILFNTPGCIDIVILHEDDTGLLLMLAHLLRRESRFRQLISIHLLIPMSNKDPDEEMEVSREWKEYLRKVRIEAEVHVFYCINHPREVNAALKLHWKRPSTKLTLVSMQCEASLHDPMNKHSLAKWIEHCLVRTSGMDNVLLVWNVSNVSPVGE